MAICPELCDTGIGQDTLQGSEIHAKTIHKSVIVEINGIRV